MAFKTEIELVDSILVRTVGGVAHNLKLKDIKPNVFADLIVTGATVILNNTFNSGGKDKPEAEKLAAMLKRIDAWYAGNFTIIERGESQYGAMRDQYIAEQAEKFGRSRAQVEKLIKDTVSATLGKDASATFANFLLAVATQKREAMIVAKTPIEHVPSVTAIREEIETALAERTAKAAAERAEIAKGIDVTDLGF